jgi:UTP--glucose-1-phosphate uridylyltransferase
MIRKKGDKRLKSEYSKIIKYKKMIKFVYQNSPLGTGDAVLKCEKYIKSENFLMLLPDDLILKKNCSLEMLKVHRKYNCSVIASKKVEKKNVSRWGIFKLKKHIKNNFLIESVIEKPSIKKAPSNYAVIGRYILPYKIFKILKKKKRGKDGEIHITDAIKQLIIEENKFMGHIFSGKYLDCGTMKGYVNSSLEVSRLKL